MCVLRGYIRAHLLVQGKGRSVPTHMTGVLTLCTAQFDFIFQRLPAPQNSQRSGEKQQRTIPPPLVRITLFVLTDRPFVLSTIHGFVDQNRRGCGTVTNMNDSLAVNPNC